MRVSLKRQAVVSIHHLFRSIHQPFLNIIENHTCRVRSEQLQDRIQLYCYYLNGDER